jgi:hypothetical protein
MLYMVIERYGNGADAVYERALEKGRMLPDGLEYIDSWVEADRRERCFQLMRAEDPSLFETWISNWSDLADFEIVAVITSAEAAGSHIA